MDLYDFAGQGQNHKRGANSLTAAARRNDEEAEGTRPIHTLIFSRIIH
jgi:hypothetical protein